MKYGNETIRYKMKNKQEVIQWGADRGILSKATPMSQAIKTLSEVEELLRAIMHGNGARVMR